jgi:hypothetical protein
MRVLYIEINSWPHHTATEAITSWPLAARYSSLPVFDETQSEVGRSSIARRRLSLALRCLTRLTGWPQGDLSLASVGIDHHQPRMRRDFTEQ